MERTVSRLTDARVRAHWTLPEFAAEAGISLDTVKRAEKGLSVGLLSRQKIVDALSRKLGVTLQRSDFWPEEMAS